MDIKKKKFVTSIAIDFIYLNISGQALSVLKTAYCIYSIVAYYSSFKNDVT